MNTIKHFGLDFDTFVNIIDNLHDEIIIYDNNYKMLYVNKACERHYGFTPDRMLGLSFDDTVNTYGGWNKPLLPAFYEHKRPFKQVQQTFLGLDVLTIGVPILNTNGDVEYVALSIRDDFHEGQIPSFDEFETNAIATTKRPEHIIYRSKAMQEVILCAQRFASLDAPCLLLGESGCGKSLLAKYIHSHSPRANKPFVVVNCAAIPEQLFESEFFGHVKGAFSGALEARGGLISKAEGGTLFLDEISELPLAMQTKLLHVVQEMEYRSVGSSTTVKADVRFLAASNRDLDLMAHDGAFRQDLLFRLNVFDIVIPPIRERSDDIEPLLFHFLNYYNKKHKTAKSLNKEVQNVFYRYAWPGNTRELAHIIERLVVTTDRDSIGIENLPSALYQSNSSSTRPCPPSDTHAYGSLDATLEATERKLILDAFMAYGSSRKVAAALDISQSRATRLIRKYLAQGESK